MNRYSRNSLYISEAEQARLKSTQILIAGCGIGSNIAECSLRLGFENLCLIDGDTVELSNLNRQNYHSNDIAHYKAEALEDRLKKITPEANIKITSAYITNDNIDTLIQGQTIAINALDFTSSVPFLFDTLCQERNIPILHPYNFGWGALIFAVLPNGQNLTTISSDPIGFEKKVAAYLLNHLKGKQKEWVSSILDRYEKTGSNIPPPQLAVGSWLAAGACTNLLYNIAVNKPIRSFPDFYFLTANE